MFSDKNGEFDSPLSTPRLPSLIALRSFEAAARLENFSRAAVELHITHGAVSRAVRLLEEDLGVLLFERRSQRVYLTDAGRTLARAANEGVRYHTADCRFAPLRRTSAAAMGAVL